MKKIISTSVLMLAISYTALAQKSEAVLNKTEILFNLKKEVTQQLPVGMKAYFASDYISLMKDGHTNVMIVKSDRPEDESLQQAIKQQLSKAWKIDIPLVDWNTAKSSSSNMILFGAANSNMPLRRLEANWMLGNNTLGYEVRVIPNALDWKKDVIYLGGKDQAEITQAVQVLVQKAPKPNNIKVFIDCHGWNKEPDAGELEAMMTEYKAHYAKFDSRRTELAMQDLMAKPVLKYKMTGNDAYAKVFSEMQKILIANYDKHLDALKTPPSFIFHLFPTYLYNIETSKEFSAEDRLAAAEFTRKLVERMMTHWEMADPIKFYEASTQDYLTNHSCFAARSVSASARYLLSRYNYEPARYWQAVADNGFDGVAPHPFSPEDAAGYQYLVYQLFIDYALASGRYDLDFFKSPVFKDYLEYCKSQFNHLGYTAGFGDAYPISHANALSILKQAVDILGDKEAAYLVSLNEDYRKGGTRETLTLDPPGKHTHGLNYVKLTEFKQKQFDVQNFYRSPVLDKAIFRSGWDEKADFMSITGINGDGYNHSHFDANGISQYISGNRVWLQEGDYIKKFPDDHNSIVVNRNGTIIDQSREFKPRRKSSVSQIKAAVQNENRTYGLLSLELEDYNGVNWTRNINYAAQNGFWVIDELDVKIDGNYTTECYWRSVGKMIPRAQAVEFVQKESTDNTPFHFFIAEGNGAIRSNKTLFEAGHGRKDGYLTGYKFSDKNTRYVIQRKVGEYKKGDKILYVNFLHAIPGKAPAAPVISKLSTGVFLVNSNKINRLAIIGNYSDKEISVKADRFFIGPEGIVASGATFIKLPGKEWSSETKVDIAWDLPEQLRNGQLNSFLLKMGSKKEVIPVGKPTELAVKNLNVTEAVGMTSKVSVIAQEGKIVAVGSSDGTFTLLDHKGETVFSKKFKSGISAISAVKTSAGTNWAVAFLPENLRIGEAKVNLLDSEGQVLWEKTITSYQKRNGTVTTLFTAKLDKSGEPSIIAGSQGWHYYAYSLNGKQVWRAPVTHGATVGAAGDMDGDGLDDIASGVEYYYHTIISPKGQVGPRITTSPWDYSVAVLDLNADGKKEAVFGRGDGFLYVMAPEKNKFPVWRLNVGGKPVSVVELPGQDAKLATATEMGDVVFVDGSGKRVGLTKLPAQLTDLKFQNNKLLALCIDGFAYVMDLKGQVTGKFPYQYDYNSIQQQKIAVGADFSVFFSGNTVYYVRL